jgi:AcrR family transcriptional regulator
MALFWQVGYEPATVAMLCSAMEITAPSLSAAFGNKAQLFLEVVQHYETVHWDAAWQRLEKEPHALQAIETFFLEAARMISSGGGSPGGCMVVLAATNVSPEAHDIAASLKGRRDAGEKRFLRRLSRAIADGQLPPRTDAVGFAATLNTLLQGMSVQARDGASSVELESIARIAMRVLPQPI